MKAQTIRSFEKDVRCIRDKKLKLRLDAALAEISEAEELTDISDMLPLSGYSGCYRMRVGDYRLGFYIEGDTLILAHFLHRHEIYRYFP